MTAPDLVATLSLPARDDAPSAARSFLAGLGDRVPTPMASDAAVMLSELVTNAVRYGRGTIELRLRVMRDTFRVEVHDEGVDDIAPVTLVADPTRLGGRGLFIVGALASRWGVGASESRRGNTVWFELDLEPG